MQVRRAVTYALLLVRPNVVGARTPRIGLAEAAAKVKGTRLLSGAGKTDGDIAGQVGAIDHSVAKCVDT